MPILISGSLAYDYIMNFPDSFKNHILPEQIHILNVCFVVDKLKKNLGGCATNIAYSSKLLGGDPLIIGPVGRDGGELLDFFEKNNITTKYIKTLKDEMTSSAHITTDQDDNQVVAYHNGAGNHATDIDVRVVSEQKDIAIIAPTKKEAMILHATQCVAQDIPFCFDPSHQLTTFNDHELREIIAQATFYIANDYEMELTQKITGWNIDDIREHVKMLIVTKGVQGSEIYTKDKVLQIKSCQVQSVDDPTGAGDAYRGGFFAAYTKGLDMKTCGQVASVAAAYAIEHYGTVNHSYTFDAFKIRYEENYGELLNF